MTEYLIRSTPGCYRSGVRAGPACDVRRWGGTTTGDTARVRIAIDARPASDAEPTGVGHYTRRMLAHLPAAMPSDELVAWHPRAGGSDLPRSPNLTEHVSRIPGVLEPVWRRLEVPRLEGHGAVRRAPRDELPPAADPQRRRRARRARPGVRGDARGGSGVRRAVAAPVRRVAAAQRRGDRALGEREGRPARTPPARRGPRARDPARGGPVRGARRPTRSNASARGSGSGGRSRCSSAGSSRARTWPRWSRRSRASADAGALARDRRRPDVLGPAGHRGPHGRRSRRSPRAFGGAWCSPATCRTTRSARCWPARRCSRTRRGTRGSGSRCSRGSPAGVPVLTSSAASLPEVAGDAALLVDPNDADAIGDGLVRLFGDAGPARTARRRRAASVSRAFSWERAAGATAEVLRGGRGPFGRRSIDSGHP